MLVHLASVASEFPASSFFLDQLVPGASCEKARARRAFCCELDNSSSWRAALPPPITAETLALASSYASTNLKCALVILILRLLATTICSYCQLVLSESEYAQSQHSSCEALYTCACSLVLIFESPDPYHSAPFVRHVCE